MLATRGVVVVVEKKTPHCGRRGEHKRLFNCLPKTALRLLLNLVHSTRHPFKDAVWRRIPFTPRKPTGCYSFPFFGLSIFPPLFSLNTLHKSFANNWGLRRARGTCTVTTCFLLSTCNAQRVNREVQTSSAYPPYLFDFFFPPTVVAVRVANRCCWADLKSNSIFFSSFFFPRTLWLQSVFDSTPVCAARRFHSKGGRWAGLRWTSTR